MIRLIDVNCRLGEGPAPRKGAPRAAADYLALMDEWHVEKALAFHAVAQYADARLGNTLLAEETGGSERFSPQWAVLPALWDVLPAPAEWLAEMKKNGVKTARLFPKQYGHSLRRYAAGPLLDALAECRVPEFIALDQLDSWDALYGLCREYPANRFVMCSPGYRCLRYLIPILNECDNLYVETSNFLGHGAIGDFCRFQGAGRLLFGSGMPEASLAAAASQLLLSDISEEEKALIGGGNAKRLLGEVAL